MQRSWTVWIAFFILILVRLPLFKARSYLLAAALAGAFSLALFNISDGADHSTSVRAETTRIGFQIASEQVYRGIGFNKFKDTEYSTATMESVIHNTVSSYVASMGWPIGLALLLFLAFPLIMPRSRCLSYMAPVLVILLFTMSDAFYFAPTYFLIAYAAAKNLPVRTVVS